MREVQNIVKFKVVLRSSHIIPTNGSQLRMEHLSNLSISAKCEAGKTRDFLNRLVLLSLSNLDYSDVITDEYEMKTWSHTEFIGLLVRSSCHIKRLVMYIGVLLNKCGITQLLQFTPEIEHLGISTDSEIRCTSFILSLLTYLTNTPGPCLAPHLKSLALEECDSVQWRREVENLLRMLESRWNAQNSADNVFDGPLERVSCVDFQSDDLEFCGTLLRIDINVHYNCFIFFSFKN